MLPYAPLLLPLLAACSQAGAESAGGDRPYKVGRVERGEVRVIVEQTGVVEPGTPLLLGEKEVGRLTSVAVSPSRGPIGLALVRRQAEPGATLSAGDGDVVAEVVELPF
jgi:glycine cleavage system aminomethyltransferase T